MAGIALCLAGTAVLVGWTPSPMSSHELLAACLSVIATAIYGYTIVFTKVHLKEASPLGTAAGTLLMAAVALAGVGLGLAFGSRILAGLAAPAGLAALLLVVAIESTAGDWKTAAQRCGQFLWAMLPALGLGYLIMGLLWPWSIVSPLNPIYALEYFDTFFEKPWKELYAGQLISVPDMPASYLPRLFMMTLPEVMLALGLIGIAGAVVAILRRATPLNHRASLLMLTLAALLPVAIAMATRPALYNGLRHFIFVVPPLAVLGGLAFGWLFERARRLDDGLGGRVALSGLAAVFIAGLGLPIVDMVRLHPYQYTSFNTLSGGVSKAHDNYMLDYWGLAFKQAANELRARLGAAADHPPGGRPWVVAICGPQSSAREELGPEFETTFDQKQADFALALGTFYCRHLQAPIMATIEREGVVYATVYDFRGSAGERLINPTPP